MSRVLPSVLTLMLLLMAAPASSSAQPRRTSSDIQAQIQRSADLQRQALQILTEPERAEGLIGNAYAELQTALSTMLINASGQKSRTRF
jgi:phage host-nuclease inhibitor protein Gam